MKSSLLAIGALLGGFLYFYLTYTPTPSQYGALYSIDGDDLKNFETGFLFLDIFLNNLMIGVLLAIFGFITGGAMTLILLFWNGYLLSMIYSASIGTLPTSEILSSSKHIPLELFSFLLYAQIGLRGFGFFRQILLHKKIDTQTIPNPKKLIAPTIILFVASILETL